jgi:hypothetical protein
VTLGGRGNGPLTHSSYTTWRDTTRTNSAWSGGEPLCIREPEPEACQAALLVALEASDLRLHCQAKRQFRQQLHPPTLASAPVHPRHMSPKRTPAATNLTACSPASARPYSPKPQIPKHPLHHGWERDSDHKTFDFWVWGGANVANGYPLINQLFWPFDRKGISGAIADLSLP